MSDIFISYSRKDIAYARLLHEALKKNEFETWVDWQDIPPSIDWLKEVFTAIEQANTFIFILSASSINSEVCNLEIEHAAQNNKRLIPIVIDDLDPSNVHPSLAALNWIFSRTEDEFQPAIEDLITAIETDYEWVKVHTRLQVRALEWERTDNDKSFLLRGTDLSQAEDWLAVAEDKPPEPTLLQTRYIQSSRQEATKRQRQLLFAVGGAFIITVILGIAALINGQRATRSAVSLSTQVVVAQNAEATAEQESFFRATQQAIAEEQRGIAEEQQAVAEEQRDIAIARQLGSEALNNTQRNYDLGLLLSLEANALVQGATWANGNLLETLQSNAHLVRYLHHDSNIARSIAFSPDGDIMATGGDSKDLLIRLWDMNDPENPQLIGVPFTEHDSSIVALAFSPNGEILASASVDSTFILWDVRSPERIQKLSGPTETHRRLVGVHSLAFTPDSQILATGIPANILLWDINDPTNPQQIGSILEGHPGEGPVHFLAFIKNGNVLISSAWKTLVFWDVSTPEFPVKINDPVKSNSRATAINEAGDILATGGYDQKITLWDISDPETPQPIGQPLTGHSGPITHLRFSPDGTILASAANEHGFSAMNIRWKDTIIFWDIRDPTKPEQTVEPYTGHQDSIENVNFTPDGEYLFSSSPDNTLIIWDGDPTSVSHKLGVQITGHTDRVNDVAIHPSGDILASASSDNTIRLWDISRKDDPMQIGQPLNGHLESVVSVAFHPTGELLASSSYDNTILLWDTQNPQSATLIGDPITGFEKGVISLGFSPDGGLLASGTIDGKINLWDISNPEDPKQIGETLTGYSIAQSVVTQGVCGLIFSPDGQILYSGSDDTSIILWDISDLENPAQIGEPLSGHTSIMETIALNPDGTMLASGGQDNRIILWDINDPENPFMIGEPIDSHLDSVTDLTFSPNGNLLASASFDNTIILWDLTTPEIPQQIGKPLVGHEKMVLALDITPDGKTLASGGSDTSISLWNLSEQTWKETACTIVGRNLTETEWSFYLPFIPYRKTCEQYP